MCFSKSNYLIFFFIAFFHIAVAQQKKSVILSYKVQKINQLLAEAIQSYPTDSAKAKKLNADALSLSKERGYTLGIAQAYNLYGKIENQYKRNIEAEAYYQKASIYAIKAENQHEYALAQIGLSRVYAITSNFKKSIETATIAIPIFERENDKGGMITCYNTLGVCYNRLVEKDKAIEYYLKALRIIESIPNKPKIAAVQNNLGQLFWEIGQNKEAQNYFLSTIKSAREAKDVMNEGLGLSNLSNTYIDEKDYTTGIKYIEEALAIFEKLHFTNGIVNCVNNVGALYVRKKEYDNALPYLKKNTELATKGNDNPSIILAYQNLGYCLTEMKRYKEAEEQFKIAEKYTNSGPTTPYVLGEFYKNRSFLDSLIGNYQSALNNRNKYSLISDKLKNDKISKEINDLNTKYQTEKKEASILLLNKENNLKAFQLKNNQLEIEQNKNLIDKQNQTLIINQLEIKNKNQLVKNQQLDAEKKAQNIKSLKKQSQIQTLEIENKELELKKRNLVIGIILIMFLAVGTVSFSLYNRDKLKQSNLLQAEIFKQQEIATQSLFDGEQKERIRIARDLHDSIGQMLSVVKMNVSSLGDMGDKNTIVETTATLVDKTIDEVRHISHNLIPEELNFGLFSALESLCDKINVSKQIMVTLTVPEHIQGHKFEKQNELSIYRIVQEVLNNMVKYAGATEISLNVLRIDNLMIIHIKDNGKGFDTNDIKQSKGLGWKNIAARVNMLNGKLQVSSEILTGTEIEITIPEWNKQKTV